MLDLIFFLIMGLLLFASYKGFKEQKGQKKQEEKFQKDIKRIRDFDANKKLMSVNNRRGILIDNGRHKIGFVYGINNIKIYGFKDVLAVELVEDGKSLMKTSGTSMAGRALLGGALLGPLGAVVGGVTGKKNQEDIVSGVNLIITLNNSKNPIYTYKFLENNDVNKKSSEYVQATQAARKWHAYIKVVIERAEENDTQVKNGQEFFNAEYETDKLNYLQNAIGSREKYHNTIRNYNFNKIEEDILMQASVSIMKDNLGQKMIDRVYDILLSKKDNNLTSPSKQLKEKTIQTIGHENNQKEISPSNSVADELIKLKSLKDEGILSEEEFLLQKNKLLNE